jgi:hypothetical protein
MDKYEKPMRHQNFARLTLVAVAIFALDGAAFANNFSVFDLSLQHVTPGKSATGTLDLTKDGFVAPDSLASFTVTFDFDRPNGSGSSTDPIVDISLDGFSVLTGGTVPDFGTMSYTFTQLTPDGSALLSAINSTGKLSYDVTTGTGNYYLVDATLGASDPVTRMPDVGSTVTLLGLGILGLTAVARKFRFTR